MNGVKYNRIMQGMSRDRLSKITGISIPTLKTMEKAVKPRGICASNYRKVSDALKVSPDDLIRSDYPDAEDGGPIRAPYPSRTENKSNCISVYRNEKRMSFQQLAYCLGVTSRERARQACSIIVPLENHIAALAKHENISIGEFKRKYSFKEENCA